MKRVPKLLGIAGKARTGKNTLADFIEAQYGGYQYSFAAPIKRMLKAGLNIDLDDSYWAARKEEVIPALGRSPRELMQTLGTEWGRQLVHPEIWLTLATATLNKRGPGMILPDLRFENEAAWVRRLGGTVLHISRETAPEVAAHSSESGIQVMPGDIEFYNNSSLEAMQFGVSKLFRE